MRDRLAGVIMAIKVTFTIFSWTALYMNGKASVCAPHSVSSCLWAYCVTLWVGHILPLRPVRPLYAVICISLCELLLGYVRYLTPNCWFLLGAERLYSGTVLCALSQKTENCPTHFVIVVFFGFAEVLTCPGDLSVLGQVKSRQSKLEKCIATIRPGNK